MTSEFVLDSWSGVPLVGTCSVLFSDARWLPLTLLLIDEWVRVGTGCVFLFNWGPRPSICDQVFCGWSKGKESFDWGGDEYFDRIGQRVRVVKDLLNQTMVDLFVIDSDVVLKSDITSGLNDGFVFQQEIPCQTTPVRPCVNGGVWWVKHSAESRERLDEVVRVMDKLDLPDQDAFQIVLGGSSQFWSRDQAVNGGILSSKGFVASGLYHVNWMKTFECKRLALTQIRQGYLDVARSCWLTEEHESFEESC